VHDPLVDVEAGETVTDSINMPILKKTSSAWRATARPVSALH